MQRMEEFNLQMSVLNQWDEKKKKKFNLIFFLFYRPQIKIKL